MTDILQMIDAAIDDYSVSVDAMRSSPTIAPRRPGPTRSARPSMPQQPQMTPEQREAVLAMVREYSRQWALAVDEFFGFVGGVCRQVEASASAHGLLPPPVPVDPMQRALEARRNRNTGPQARLRAPRRIDATRAR